MNVSTKKLHVKKDERGWLAELLRPEDLVHQKFGQILLTTALPGQTKGNHYHTRKTEWYCVLKGKGLLTLTDNATGEKQELVVSEQELTMIKIPPNHLHAIKNIGDNEMYLLAYIDEEFNPNDPDTFYNDQK